MSFTTAINCMDGRVQFPVIEYIKEKYGTDYVDMITVAGPDGTLAEGTNTAVIENIFKRVGISIKAHGSTEIIIAGHADCAGHPVSKEEHIRSIRKAVDLLHEKFTDVTVEGIWLDEDFSVHSISSVLQEGKK